MTPYPIKGLTNAQKRAVELLAIGDRKNWFHPSTIESLNEKGIVAYEGDEVVGRDRFGTIAVPIYTVMEPHKGRIIAWLEENADEILAAADSNSTG